MLSCDKSAWTWRCVQGSEGSASQSNPQWKKKSCQINGQRAFEMMPWFRWVHENSELSWSHGMLEHWHCFFGLQPQPRLTVLMQQSHIEKKNCKWQDIPFFSSSHLVFSFILLLQLAHWTLHTFWSASSAFWGAVLATTATVYILSLAAVVWLRLNDNMLKIGSQRHRG